VGNTRSCATTAPAAGTCWPRRCDADELDRTYIIPLDGALDCVNNFPTASQPVNAYNAATWTFQAQDFHPANSGYFQISDAYWGFLLANP